MGGWKAMTGQRPGLPGQSPAWFRSMSMVGNQRIVHCRYCHHNHSNPSCDGVLMIMHYAMPINAQHYAAFVSQTKPLNPRQVYVVDSVDTKSRLCDRRETGPPPPRPTKDLATSRKIYTSRMLSVTESHTIRCDHCASCIRCP